MSLGHRALMRVPLDFAWPIGEIWEGYFNPYPNPPECNLCGGSGYNPATKQIDDDFYAYYGDRSRAWYDKITEDEARALIDKRWLLDSTHIWIKDKGWVLREDAYFPTAEEINAWQHYRYNRNGSQKHNSASRFILVEIRAKRLGVYGKCPACDGKGWLPHPDEKIRKLCEEWEEYEPPTGEGYQLWDTTTEGSPMSPVFATAEELADWCADNATIFAYIKISREKWLKMFVEESLDTGSLITIQSEFIGPVINSPFKEFK